MILKRSGLGFLVVFTSCLASQFYGHAHVFTTQFSAKALTSSDTTVARGGKYSYAGERMKRLNLGGDFPTAHL